VIGDGGLYFYIQDVIVHSEYQNQGFGKVLMKEFMNYISANAKTGAFIGLMAAKGLEKYYEFLDSKHVMRMPQECIRCFTNWNSTYICSITNTTLCCQYS